TFTSNCSKGSTAGPWSTSPSSPNLLWWHRQRISVVTSWTVQPPWVHEALNARNVPGSGWVITSLASISSSPPPSGTSVVCATTVPRSASCGFGVAPQPVAVSATAPAAPVPASIARRLIRQTRDDGSVVISKLPEMVEQIYYAM